MIPEKVISSPQGAFVVFVVAVVPLIGVGVSVIYSAVRRDEVAGIGNTKLLALEAAWLLMVLSVWGSVNASSLGHVPFESDGTVEESVDVEAYMWGYNMSDRTFEKGETVRFEARSTDTLHSFSVYGPEGSLRFTVMLVPGTEHTFTHSFEETGHYTVRCLEYCGTGHAYMKTSLTVVAQEEKATREVAN
ncbi:MAG: hypothetical protein SV760_03165 [Halobacteria archaeon]|nr:hypothetical protein [Halobacteria archaeon]